MTYLLSIDPGLSSGVALGTYSATEPYRRVGAWQPRGGTLGFSEWWAREGQYLEPNEIICERFSTRQPLSHDAAEPLRVEGWLVGEGIMPPYPGSGWVEPAEMYFMAAPSDPLRVKKKKAQDFLKRHGLWATGKAYGHADGADVNSATLHAIALLRTRRHAPTLGAYSPPRAA